MPPEDQPEEANRQDQTGPGNGSQAPPRESLPSASQGSHFEPAAESGQRRKADKARRLLNATIAAFRSLGVAPVLAAAAIVQAIVSVAQWSALQDANTIAQRSAIAATKSANIADQALRLTQRPYLSLRLPENVSIQTGLLQLVINVTNEGPAAATNVARTAKLGLLKLGNESIDLSGLQKLPEIGGSSLAPHSTFAISVGPTRDLAADYVEKLKSSAYALLLVGSVSYDDPFGEKHFKNFCMYYKFLSDGSQRDSGTFCNTMNDGS